MRRNLTALALTLALGALGAPGAAAQDAPGKLSIGDPAPALAVGRWIKGEPLKELGHGAVTVLDFWATWCGPCIAAIPHMSEVQAKYADKQVNVVGVSIWEKRPSGVVPFVEKRDSNETKGDEMAYRVAMDDVPPLPPGVEEGSPEAAAHAAKGKMALTWMQAAGRNGIPTVFIVDRQGRVAWIGHPMGGMDEALEQIVAGTWNLEQAREEALQAARVEELEGRIFAKVREGDLSGAVALARGHVDTTLAESPGVLNLVAWIIVDPEGSFEATAEDLALALEAASRANERTEGQAAEILDTLARVHFALGHVQQAVELQRAAIERAAGPQREGLKRTLEEYEAAVG